MKALLLSVLRFHRQPAVLRHAYAATLVFAAFGLRYALFGPGPGFPHLLFFPAVFASAVLFGRGPGLSAALLSGVLANWFFVAHTGDAGELAGVSADDALSMALYLAAAVGAVLLIDALHTAYSDVAKAHNRLQRAQGATQDEMAERRRTEDALRTTSETLATLVDASPTAIVALDLEMRVLTWNRAAERIFGFTAEDILGHPYTAIVPQEESGGLQRLREQLLHGAVIRGERLRRRRKDGSQREVTASGAALFTADGAPSGFVVVLDDITEREAVEEQLRQAQKMEAVGQLTGGLAHDFNNLLCVVVGNLDLLRDRLDTGPDAEILREALDAALRGADLTRRLLAFARRQPLQPRKLELNTVVSGTAKLLSRTLGEMVEVRLTLAGDIGAVLADPAQLEAALTNLAVNARDAMPGGGRLTIATRNATLDADYAAAHAEVRPGNYVLLEVTDSGTGMTAEVVARVFEPFFTTKEAGRGTGLGLSMVFGFAKQSGGHVKIYSEPGHGTTVRLYLPRADEVEDSGSDLADVGPAARRGQGTVLAVEDNEALRRVLVRHLTDLGYEVLEAGDARAALAVLADSPRVDLLLTDIIMPGGVNGWELARAAKQLRPGLKVLFTSGFPDAAFDPGGALSEGSPLLSKPYRKQDLARMLGEVLPA
jgi:PAS domain S-box-containing protein